jgi:ribonuclease inhibitor
MSAITIDCSEVKSEADFWQAYVESCRPQGADAFGRNLDAFWDAVSAGGPGFPLFAELRFVNVEALKVFRDGAFYEALLRIAHESKDIRVSFG